MLTAGLRKKSHREELTKQPFKTDAEGTVVEGTWVMRLDTAELDYDLCQLCDPE